MEEDETELHLKMADLEIENNNLKERLQLLEMQQLEQH
jgi:hypothetical protein